MTLALDFPVRKDVSFDLLQRLGDITLDHGGRMYPAKDATMTPRQFQAFYRSGSSSLPTLIRLSTRPSGRG